MNIPKTAQELHDYFAAIPDEKWGTGVASNPQTGQRCAYGLLALLPNDGESASVIALGKAIPAPSIINDGDDRKYQQGTPKARILAALVDAGATPTP